MDENAKTNVCKPRVCSLFAILRTPSVDSSVTSALSWSWATLRLPAGSGTRYVQCYVHEDELNVRLGAGCFDGPGSDMSQTCLEGRVDKNRNNIYSGGD